MLMSAMNGPVRQLAATIKAYAEKLEANGGAPVEAAAPAAESAPAEEAPASEPAPAAEAPAAE